MQRRSLILHPTTAKERSGPTPTTQHFLNSNRLIGFDRPVVGPKTELIPGTKTVRHPYQEELTMVEASLSRDWEFWTHHYAFQRKNREPIMTLRAAAYAVKASSINGFKSVTNLLPGIDGHELAPGVLTTPSKVRTLNGKPMSPGEARSTVCRSVFEYIEKFHHPKTIETSRPMEIRFVVQTELTDYLARRMTGPISPYAFGPNAPLGSGVQCFVTPCTVGKVFAAQLQNHELRLRSGGAPHSIPASKAFMNDRIVEVDASAGIPLMESNPDSITSPPSESVREQMQRLRSQTMSGGQRPADGTRTLRSYISHFEVIRRTTLAFLADTPMQACPRECTADLLTMNVDTLRQLDQRRLSQSERKRASFSPDSAALVCKVANRHITSLTTLSTIRSLERRALMPIVPMVHVVDLAHDVLQLRIPLGSTTVQAYVKELGELLWLYHVWFNEYSGMPFNCTQKPTMMMQYLVPISTVKLRQLQADNLSVNRNKTIRGFEEPPKGT